MKLVARLLAECTCPQASHMGASINRGPQNRPKCTMILPIGTTKMGPPIFGNSHILSRRMCQHPKVGEAVPGPLLHPHPEKRERSSACKIQRSTSELSSTESLNLCSR